jgi:hypothetical protein
MLRGSAAQAGANMAVNLLLANQAPIDLAVASR